MDGRACYACPTGAQCNETVRRATETLAIDYGTTSPRTSEGFYLFAAPASKHEQNCDPTRWKSDDPCKQYVGKRDNLTEVIHACSTENNFNSYWPADRVFSCLSGKSFYACDVSSLSQSDDEFIFLISSCALCCFIIGDKCMYKGHYCRGAG